MNLVKTLWKDPVWSKVIAAGIILIIGWLFKWYIFVWEILQDLMSLFISHYQLVIIILLFLIIIYQFNKNKKQNEKLSSNKKKESGLEWLSKLEENDFHKYFFLFWFPINHRVQTHNMFHSESLNHIPEIRRLFERKVLFAQPINGIEYVIEIDKNIYDYMEDIYINEFNNADEDMKRIVSNFRSTPFHMLFPKANLF